MYGEPVLVEEVLTIALGAIGLRRTESTARMFLNAVSSSMSAGWLVDSSQCANPMVRSQTASILFDAKVVGMTITFSSLFINRISVRRASGASGASERVLADETGKDRSLTCFCCSKMILIISLYCVHKNLKIGCYFAVYKKYLCYAEH